MALNPALPRRVWPILLSAVLVSACGSSDPLNDLGGEPPPLQSESLDDELQPLMLQTQLRGCDFMNPDYCQFPWPSDFFTVADDSTPTGRRINLNPLGMPMNLIGLPVRPNEWNRNDGFSPGQMIVTHVQGLDLEASGVKGVADIEASLAPDAPIFVLDADTGERHPIWAEIDASETAGSLCDAPGTAADLVNLVAGEAGLDDALENLEGVVSQVTGGLEQGCTLTLQPILAALGEALHASGIEPNSAFKVDPPALLMRPGINFKDGHRYIVVMRKLRDAEGELLEAPVGFRVYRDRHVSELEPVNARREHMESLFATLAAHGVRRDELYMAWDFTVASVHNTAGRLLAMRDTALFAQGTSAPAFEITEVQDMDGGATIRRINGRMTVPNFLTLPDGICDNLLPPVSQNLLDYCAALNRISDAVGGSGVPVLSDVLGPVTGALGLLQELGQIPFSRLYYGNSDSDVPQVNPAMPTQEFAFQCEIPRTAVGSFSDANTWLRPATPTLYGHGLLGGKGEVGGGSTARLREQNILHCAVDWVGMATRDVPSVVTFLLDMSNFPTLPDRVQQGVVNFHFLGRLLTHPDGFASHPAFQTADGRSVINGERLIYDGNSQGGIIGGVVVATSTDLTRASLGVPGMNYSTLLRRSVDFDAYGSLMYLAYPNSFDQSFILSLIQMLWDRGETNGYANHLRRPDAFTALGHPTPDHEVMLNVAFGDHQVADVTAEIMARSFDGAVHLPGTEPGRHSNVNPYWGLRAARNGESGSVMVVWDIGDLDNDYNPGTATSPATNIPPRQGRDPHSDPRAEPAGGIQRQAFLLDDTYLNVCGDRPCFARDYVSLDVANQALGNLVPFVNAPGPVQARAGGELPLIALASDPDRDELSYVWSITEGAECVAALNDADTATATLLITAECGRSQMAARVTVSDGRGGSASEALAISLF
jgi:hypothetical protein